MRTFRPVSKDKANLRIRPSEVAIAILAPVAAFALRAPDRLLQHPPTLVHYIAISAAITIAVMLHHRVGATVSRYFNTYDAFLILRAAAISVVFATAAAFMLDRMDGIPRTLPAIHFLVLSFSLVIACYIRGEWRVRLQRRRRGSNDASRRPENVLVVGANHCAMIYIRLARLHQWRDRRVLAILDANPRLRGRSIAGCSVIAETSEIEALIREYALHGIKVDSIFLAKNRLDLTPAEIAAIEQAAAAFDCVVSSRETLFEERIDDFTSPFDQRPRALAHHAGLGAGPLWRAKRALDILVAGAACLFLAPLLIPIALLLLVDLGWPVLFWQERLGRFGASIKVIKFRTMKPAEERATGLGAWLRRLRLDELPQIWNILRGEMSLVGPRPLLAAEQSEIGGFRLAVRPGLTGWAQVCGGRLCSVEEKAALDEWYIRHASFALEVRIVLLTLVVLWRGEQRREAAIAQAMEERAWRHRQGGVKDAPKFAVINGDGSLKQAV